MDSDWATVGTFVAEVTAYTNGPPRVGVTTHIVNVTDRLIVTADGGRYSRTTLWPTNGRNLRRTLHSADDPIVVVARIREHVTALARMASNLAMLEWTKPEQVVTALDQIREAANFSWQAAQNMTAAARLVHSCHAVKDEQEPTQ